MTQEFVTLPREVVEQAIEALFCTDSEEGSTAYKNELEAVKKLRAALERPQGNQEPVAWLYTDGLGGKQAFTNEPPPGIKALCQPLVCSAMLDAAPQPPAPEQPQANQPAMTPIAQRKLDSLLTEGYTISGYSIYHEQKHQHGFVTGDGLVGWWKPEGMEYPQPRGEQEPVSVARVDDLEGGGRVRALAMNLSLDAPLYTHPQPKREPLPDHYINGMFSAASLAEGDMFRRFARAIEAAHNIK